MCLPKNAKLKRAEVLQPFSLNCHRHLGCVSCFRHFYTKNLQGPASHHLAGGCAEDPEPTHGLHLQLLRSDGCESPFLPWQCQRGSSMHTTLHYCRSLQLPCRVQRSQSCQCHSLGKGRTRYRVCGKRDGLLPLLPAELHSRRFEQAKPLHSSR